MQAACTHTLAPVHRPALEARAMSGGSRRRPTSFDVAERAGVSQPTVSRALSGSPAIAEATRRKVIEAAEALGYFVDERAARLRRGSTGTLAVVVICREGDNAASINPFAYALLGSVCVAASERGFETLVSFQARPEDFFGHYQNRPGRWPRGDRHHHQCTRVGAFPRARWRWAQGGLLGIALRRAGLGALGQPRCGKARGRAPARRRIPPSVLPRGAEHPAGAIH